MMTAEEAQNRAKEQAKLQLESIKSMVFRLEHAEECSGNRDDCELDDATILDGLGYWSKDRKATDEEFDEYHDEESAREADDDMPLHVEVRSGWHTPGENDGPSEYKILLCWGGPAVQIVGKLGIHNDPITAQLQYQDWYTEWENYPLTRAEENILLKYAQQFYFGEN